jgi:hypothetical protein
MYLKTATAIALALGLAGFSSSVWAGSAETKSEPAKVLPGNVGGEGAAGAEAKKEGMIESGKATGAPLGHGSTASEAESAAEKKLPGNVGGEGQARNPADAASADPDDSKAGGAMKPAEDRLPGNVGGEGAAKSGG